MQGDIREHFDMIKRCSSEPVLIKFPDEIENIDGLIIPGGESTVIGMLIEKSGIGSAIIKNVHRDMPIYGTCAGAIILAKEIVGSTQPRLGLIDIAVKRNDYGRQIESFEDDIEVNDFNTSFRAVFIRAPVIVRIGKGINTLSTYNNKPVLVKAGNILVSTFHPELTNDNRIHEYFLSICQEANK